MTEEFRLDQLCADGGTVETHERAVATFGIKLMQGMREQFLPGPAFPADEDWNVAQRTDLDEQSECLYQGSAVAHNLHFAH